MPSLAELTKKVKKLKDEHRWQADGDASAMARAAEVRADPARMARAKLVADQTAAAAQERAKLIK